MRNLRVSLILLFLFFGLLSFKDIPAEEAAVKLAQASTNNQAVTVPQAASSAAASTPASESAPAASSTAVPQTDAASALPSQEGMDARITLDLRNIEVIDSLKYFAMKSGLNIVATKNVGGRVTLMVENVKVKDIFDIMLRSNGLAYVRQGNIYNVMTEEEYKALFGKKFADLRQVKVFRLKYAIPEQAFSLLDTLKSEVGRVLVEPDSGTALIMDTPESIKRIEDALATLEQKNLVQVFNLKYAKAKDVEDQLKAQLDVKKVGSIKADERSNQIIIQALPDRMPDIERLIQALDKKTKEVLIDTKIVKVKLINELTTGFEWEGLFDAGKKFGTSYIGSYPFSVLQPATSSWQSRKSFLDAQGGNIGAYPFSGNTSSVASSPKVSPGEKMHIGMIDGKRDFDTVIKYLQTLGQTQILSNPKLAVTNNQEAKIHVGEKQAYVTTTTTSGQTTTTVSEEVTFVDVGIQLSVTPTINDEGFVTLKVKPEVSNVVSTLVTPSGNRIPIIDTSMAETTIMVKDGSTIIIGGLRKEEKTATSEQVPFFSKIPIISFFFKNTDTKSERTELLVMITPHIVAGETLTTGYERDLGIKPSKDYKEYPAFTYQTDFKPAQEAPDAKIKSYREYTDYKEKEERKPTIKGDIGND